MPIKATLYKIKRDHDNSTGFFRVNVSNPDFFYTFRQDGIGLQVNVKGTLYGASIYLERRLLHDAYN